MDAVAATGEEEVFLREIFVNLKRFDVPRRLGGICQSEDPRAWVEWIISESVRGGLGRLSGMELTFLLPEGLILEAARRLASFPAQETRSINLGCQGVFREDVAPGGNFGAFTTNRPAAAAKNLGCTWTIVGHSEERRDKLGVIAKYDPDVLQNMAQQRKAKSAVDALINEEILRALDAGLNVLVCVGETAEEKGEGDFPAQKPRIEEVLRAQLATGLKEVAGKLDGRKIVLGYEPIWAIGPGRTPPGEDYIGFVSAFIKQTVKEIHGFDPTVVYGGGLKEENAGMIARIPAIGGGLVALTRFTGEIAFEPEGLIRIVGKYLEAG